MLKEYTIEEVEAKHACDDDGRVRRFPFGFLQQRWLEFKSKIQPGDKIFAFESSPDSWKHLAGRAGYILVRGEEVIDEIITIIG